MIVLNTLFPIFALLVAGSLLKYWGMTSAAFLKTADRLVYYIFFPVMLFWKVGSASGGSGFSAGLCMAGLVAVGIVFMVSLVFIPRAGVSRFEAGSFSQACYRFNTYIGMAIVLETLGEEGVRHFGILIGFLIPTINVMAVSVLIWYADQDLPKREKILVFFRALLSNPLILGCAAGLAVSHAGVVFPVFLGNTFALISSVTLPLALISIGGSLSFAGFARHGRNALNAALFKLLLLPVVGFCCLTLFGVANVPFKVGMIFFCLPTSTAIYVLSAQLHSDTQLASAAIMLSTLGGFLSLSVALVI